MITEYEIVYTIAFDSLKEIVVDEMCKVLREVVTKAGGLDVNIVTDYKVVDWYESPIDPERLLPNVKGEVKLFFIVPTEKDIYKDQREICAEIEWQLVFYSIQYWTVEKERI